MCATKKVLFLGGSITVGCGASDYSHAWAKQTYERLAGPLFDHNCEMINGSLSGTGSFLATMRLGQQILPYKPDMVFLEYAVNDVNEVDKNRELVISSVDYIVQKLIETNPEVAITFVYTTFSGRNASEAHGVVAKHYNIPEIDLQTPLAKVIEAEEKGWRDYMPDGVHPNDIGHSFYADIVVNTILKDKERFLKPTLHAEPIGTYSFRNPRILFASPEMEQNGFVCGPGNDALKLKHLPELVVEQALYADKPGASIKVEFTGTHFGIYYRINGKMGRASVAIDGEIVGILDAYYEYPDPETPGEYICFFQKNGLPDKEHVVELTVLDEKNEKSTGNQIVIAGFLVG